VRSEPRMSLEGHSRRFRLIRAAHGRSAAPPIPGIKLRPGDRPFSARSGCERTAGLIGGGIVGSMPLSRTQQQAADLFQAAGAQESCRTHTPASLTSAQQSAAAVVSGADKLSSRHVLPWLKDLPTLLRQAERAARHANAGWNESFRRSWRVWHAVLHPEFISRHRSISRMWAARYPT